MRDESLWFMRPHFADVSGDVRPLRLFEPTPIIIGVDEVVQVGVKLIPLVSCD